MHETGPKIFQHRMVIQAVPGRPTVDGAGVNLTRLIGTPVLNLLDPFLLLDEFHSDKPQDYIAGFPAHPHRGFETVTYMLAGRVRHKDNSGHEGVIEPGGVQWMTAGRGIIHSEMPEQEDGLLWGFQLWINLPAAEKMCPPSYKEFPRNEIPTETRNGNIMLHVIAGETSRGTRGPVRDVPTRPLYFDIELASDAEFTEPLPGDANVFVYVYAGKAGIVSSDRTTTTIEQGILYVLGEGDGIQIKTKKSGTKCLLIAAQPLNEPVARAGLFVMNTHEEINQALDDYQQGRF